MSLSNYVEGGGRDHGSKKIPQDIERLEYINSIASIDKNTVIDRHSPFPAISVSKLAK
ncbi:hypothetical protein BGP_6330 [Beggiatoa sp. PS]|nr:hypothetical protein BGP_6330 [Beggiatoa sp. PS]